jgi:hypothetical protein
MDNSVDLPGYKYYVDPETGERPALFVTFVNVVEADDRVRGVAFELDDLAALDARERNYQRRRVGDLWVYVGTPEARERYQRGRTQGKAVVAAAYLETVREAFPDVEPPDLPVRELRRIDLTDRGRA